MATRAIAAAKTKSLEDAFRCAICLDVFSGPMVTECNHVFCGKCIKAAFSLKKECPTCRTPTNPRALTRDPALEAELTATREDSLAEETVINARVRFRSDAVSAAPCIEQWSCSQCSLQNSIANDRCVMCSARRPAVRRAKATLAGSPVQRYQLVPSASHAPRCEARSSSTLPPRKKVRKASVDATAEATPPTVVATARDATAPTIVTEADGVRLHLSGTCSTGYRGVRYRSRAANFEAKCFRNGQETYLGTFDTAVEGAVAYAKHLLSLGEVAAQYDEEQVTEVDGLRLHLAEESGYQKSNTGYLGVHRRERGFKTPARFCAWYHCRGKGGKVSKHLGTFGTAVEAAVAYAKYVQLLSTHSTDELEALGVVLDSRAEQWEIMYGLLLAYREREGHANVPTKHAEDGKKLGEWVRTQRKRYAVCGMSEAERKARTPLYRPLSDEELRRLEALGVVWRMAMR